MAESTQAPWYESFPEPKSTAGSINRDAVKDLLKHGEQGSRESDFILVDVRKNDHEGGTIRGSLNLPAQSIWYSLSTLYDICERAGIQRAIFYCGSSGGRGTRCAAWFQDECNRRETTPVQGLILSGGIKGWVGAGQDYRDLMEGYDPGPWNAILKTSS